jgi:hypothetical protein
MLTSSVQQPGSYKFIPAACCAAVWELSEVVALHADDGLIRSFAGVVADSLYPDMPGLRETGVLAPEWGLSLLVEWSMQCNAI